MDYKKIYNDIINRGQIRKNVNQYMEKHHIVPVCMGGINDKTNIVKLTAREHFIAHLLLVKIYPKEYGLVKAANMMCTYTDSQKCRSKNRLYEWVKVKLSYAMSESQTGKGNSQFGTCWIYSLFEKRSIKIPIEQLSIWIEQGWKKGRKLKFDNIEDQNPTCQRCNKVFSKKANEKYCSKGCRYPRKVNAFTGREEEFLELYYKNNKSMNKALKSMGFIGAVGGYHTLAKEILNKALLV